MGHCKKQMITFFTTTKCQLACKYCYTARSVRENRVNKEINFEFAKRGLEDFFESNPSRKIRFFGAGEPTLAPLFMKKITDYAYDLCGNDLVVELQTNGYFSEKMANWVSKNVNIVWISCDGPPDVQDKYRPTITNRKSSEVVERNIKFFIQKTNVELGIRATITKETLYRQNKLIDYFNDLGVKVIYADHMCQPVFEKRYGVEKYDLIDYAENFLQAREYAKSLGIFYGNFFIVNFDEKVKYSCRACTPCPHLTTDGYVSACDMAFFGNILNDLIYGKYDPISNKINYDHEKIRKIQSRNIENLVGCRDCEILEYCAGNCVGETLNDTGDMFGIRPEICAAIKYLGRHMDLGSIHIPFLHP